MLILPTPHRIIDKQDHQWSGYSLQEAIQVLKYDRELHFLRSNIKNYKELQEIYDNRISLAKEKQDLTFQMYLKEKQFNKSLQDSLKDTLREKNHYKHKASISIGGLKLGSAGLVGLILGLGLGLSLH
jgi:hypothetical protein